MHFTSNISHWVCLLTGLYLALTGFLLRDIVHDRPPSLLTPGSRAFNRQRFAGIGRRVVLIAVGLAAVAYGIARMLG